MDDADVEEGNDNPRPILRTNNNNRQGGEVSALFLQMRTIQRQQVLLQNEIVHFKATTSDLLTQLNHYNQRIL